MDNEVWRWIWLGTAVVMGLAEMVTAGFFILPFAAGAAVAFILAWFGVAVGIQWAAFVGLSVASLIVLQRFTNTDDTDQPPVGANRFVGKRGLVLEDVDRIAAEGRVRMDTEVWRATTEGDPIAAGTEVRIVGVVGSRLLVERDN
jgi:membrane protein implicated in regulation of membrane protease activity